MHLNTSSEVQREKVANNENSNNCFAILLNFPQFSNHKGEFNSTGLLQIDVDILHDFVDILTQIQVKDAAHGVQS